MSHEDYPDGHFPELCLEIEPRFGRAAYFVFVDVDTLEWQAYPNPGASASGGAGTQAAQHIANKGAQAAVSGDFDPNAYNALKAVGIAMDLWEPARQCERQ